MGVPTSEVGYSAAMSRREDHEVHKDMWWYWTHTHKNIHASVDPTRLVVSEIGHGHVSAKLRIAQLVKCQGHGLKPGILSPFPVRAKGCSVYSKSPDGGRDLAVRYSTLRLCTGTEALYRH